MKRIIIIILLVFPPFIFCCGDISSREEQRFLSPDGRVEAILIKQDAGATTSYTYKLYIVPSGDNFKKGHEVFIADKMIGLSISWDRAKSLDIKFKDGRIFHFKNFWSSKEVDNFKYNVSLNLRPIS
jgi:hypothetical protein